MTHEQRIQNIHNLTSDKLPEARRNTSININLEPHEKKELLELIENRMKRLNRYSASVVQTDMSDMGGE